MVNVSVSTAAAIRQETQARVLLAHGLSTNLAIGQIGDWKKLEILVQTQSF